MQKFDYGAKKNLQIYGTEEAPCYEVEKLKDFTIPKFLFVGTKDVIGDMRDVGKLLELLPKESTYF